VSEIESLEEIAEQTSLRVNERGRHGKFGWNVSPSTERASAAREKKKTPKPIATKPPPVESAVKPSAASIRKTANLGRLITDYRTLVETCRARADELDLSRLEIDRLGGLPTGYAGKLLGKDGGEPGRRHKKMWPVALESMLGVLGLKILLIEDDVATAKTLALRKPVDGRQQRFGNVCRISAKLLPKPSQLASPAKEPAPASRAHLRVIQGKRRGSKRAYG
jgi:hypothetical protein